MLNIPDPAKGWFCSGALMLLVNGNSGRLCPLIHVCFRFGPNNKGVMQTPSCTSLSIYSMTQEKLIEQMGSSAGMMGKEEFSFVN